MASIHFEWLEVFTFDEPGGASVLTSHDIALESLAERKSRFDKGHVLPLRFVASIHDSRTSRISFTSLPP